MDTPAPDLKAKLYDLLGQPKRGSASAEAKICAFCKTLSIDTIGELIDSIREEPTFWNWHGVIPTGHHHKYLGRLAQARLLVLVASYGIEPADLGMSNAYVSELASEAVLSPDRIA